MKQVSRNIKDIHITMTIKGEDSKTAIEEIKKAIRKWNYLHARKISFAIRSQDDIPKPHHSRPHSLVLSLKRH